MEGEEASKYQKEFVQESAVKTKQKKKKNKQEYAQKKRNNPITEYIDKDLSKPFIRL